MSKIINFLRGIFNWLFAPQVVVLIGGWGRKKDSYQNFLDQASRGFKAYSLSVLDLTQSGNIEEIHTKINLFLAENSFKRVILVGHSLGGAIALDFAYKYPSKVKKL